MNTISEKGTLPASLLLSKYDKVKNYPNHEKTTKNCRFIYLFRNPNSGLYKIGITNNPTQRLNEIRVACGSEIQEILVLECEIGYDEHPASIEMFLKDFFKSKRKHGKWFELSVKDVLAIRSLFWKIEGDWISDNVKEYLSKSKSDMN